MCRNIKPLFNFSPPATDEEIREASLQFVRKISGMNKSSTVNRVVFDRTVDEISVSTNKLFSALKTDSKTRNREAEAARARVSSTKRFQIIRIS